MANPNVKLDLRGFNRIVKSLDRGAAKRRVIKKAATRYMTFIQRRFDRMSKGGQVMGEKWEPLAESTKASRRKSRKGFEGDRKFAILVDTATLKRSLLAGHKGNMVEQTPDGLLVGIGGGARAEGSKMTVGRLAEIHHFGLGAGLPARPILVDEVDDATRRGIEKDAKAEIERVIRRNSR